MVPKSLPLSGIRVLDCSRVLAGPFATMLLADLGADVIKLEPPDGDETRSWGPPFWGAPADGLSAYFSAVNRNKRGIVVDLKKEAGRDLLNRLAERSDLLVHNFRPGTADRLGLSAERLAQQHPRLVTAVVRGFAGDRVAQDRPAYDLLAQAESGLMSVTGETSGEPSKVGVAVLDLIAGLEVAVGSLAALIGRGGTGTVQRVEVSLVEAGVTSLINVLANYIASGQEPERHGSAHPNIAPYQSFRTADGHIVIAVGNDGQFARLLKALELTDSVARFSTNADRVRRRDELAAWLGAVIRRRGRDELVDALEAVDVPAGPVLRVSESVAAMERAHGGRWLEESEGIRLAPSPLRLDGERNPVHRPPPRLGQHTAEILAELGLRGADIRQLTAAGIVRQMR